MSRLRRRGRTMPSKRTAYLRRLTAALVTSAASAGLLAAPAQATFHLTMVNEVMLASANGDAGTRFVELLDHGGTEESFPVIFAPYKLVVYDGAGNEVGQQTLNAAGLRAAAAVDRKYLVSTPAVDTTFGVTGDERLTVRLPATAGQVCFAASEPPPQAVSCLTYGKITKHVPTNSDGSGFVEGPVPPNGESDQRQADGTVIAAPPTPKAVNRTSSPPTAGKPSLTHTSLTGVARRRARLRFNLHSGNDAPAVKKIVLTLPRGLSLKSSKLRRGLSLEGRGGAPLSFSARARGHRLTVTLAHPSDEATLTAGHGALTVTRHLARRVKQHRVRRLRLVMSVTDRRGTTTRLVRRVSAT